MSEKVNYKVEKKDYRKDSVVILQGSDTREIFFLNKGMLEAKRYGQNTVGLSQNEILQKSKRIGVKEAPSIFGVQNLISSAPHDSSYIALSDCTITRYIIPSHDFISFFSSNPPIAMNVLLTMQETAKKSIVNLKKFTDFIGIADKFSDNLEILWAHAAESKESQIYKKYLASGGKIPGRIESQFLTGDYSSYLGRTYGDPSYDPFKKYDLKEVDFYHDVLKANPASFIMLMTKQFRIFLYIFEKLSDLINRLNAETERFVAKVEGKLDSFFLEDYSPFNKIYSIIDLIKKNPSINPGVLKSVVKICRSLEHINKQLGGREYVEVFPKYDRLNADIKGQSVAVEFGAAAEKPPELPGRYQTMFKDSKNKILDFSTLHDEEKENIISSLEKMKNIDPEDIFGKETRNLIQRLQDNYFKLYMNLFLKCTKQPKDIPPAVKLFMHFSFIDEKLVTEKQLELIYNSLNSYIRPKNTAFPIISLFEFLQKIYNKEEEPSLSEQGEFRKLITKNLGKGRKQIVDTQAGRLDFEIDNMVSSSMRITSDNLRAYIPFLTEKCFKGTPSELFTSPEKLDSYMKKIVSLDHTLFFRELTWKIPGKSELIKKELRPYFIVIPNAGGRVQMWQEMVYNFRSTRGRFLVPIIFNGDLYRALILSCGHYRWNMNKALVSNWMDPVEGGITGSYYDYEQNYKRNLDLSDEAKERIKEKMRSIKMDRDRFADDYYEWLVYESTGVPKLNKVLRKIFYRLIPFPKNIRSAVTNLPVYNELDRKFEIVNEREYKKLEAKFRKYAAESGSLPPDLQAFLNMMRG